MFGAEVISRQDMPDGRLGQAELRFGNSMLQLSDQMPQIGLQAPNGEWVHSSLVHYVPDVDATFAKAIEAGARQVEAVADVHDRRPVRHGDRPVRAPLGDPDEGRGRSREEADRRVKEWLAANPEGLRLSQDTSLFCLSHEEAARRNRPLRQFRRAAD